jgi:FKBP-type peptidyl-prolyl cis-trans isomerase 2
MEVADGRVVTVEYTVHLEDGTLIDSTGKCGPIAVMMGSGQLFPAIEDRIGGMKPGDTRTIDIPPEDAYGPHHPELIRAMPRDRLPPDLELEIGRDYTLKSPDKKTLRFRLLEIGDTEVRADFNAPGAGKRMTATVTVVDVREATPEEDRRGRV